MKKLLYVLLAMTVAFVMVACGGSSSGSTTTVKVTFELGEGVEGTPPAAKNVEKDTPIAAGFFPTAPTREGYLFSGWVVKGTTTKVEAGHIFTEDTTLVATWTAEEDLLDITFIAYEGADPVVVKLPAEVSFEDSGVDLPTPAQKPGLWEFANWETGTPPTVVNSASSFFEATTVTGKWYSTGFTDTVGAEKVRLANGAFVIYGFDLKTAGVTGTGPGGAITVDDLAAITEIGVKQKITEAAYETMSVRGMRVYGPYAYNGDDIIINQGSWSTGDVLHGDFKRAPEESTYLAKMNGNGAYTTADMLTFNKFHPYMSYNNAERFGYNQTHPWSNVAAITEITAAGNAIEPDVWFDVKYPMNGTIPATDTGAQNLGSTLYRLKEAGTDVLPYGTNYNKVYFAIGPSTETPTNQIVYLMKGVYLKIGATTVNGFIPDWDGDTTTREQTFASYESTERLANWRGDPAAVITNHVEGTFADDKTGIPLDQAADAEGKGYFYLRLGNWQTPGYEQTANEGTFGGQFTKGPLEVTFKDQDNRLNIALTPQQIALLNEATNLSVTIDATSDSTNDFHFYLGNATAGSGWNVAGPSATGKISDLNGEEQIFAKGNNEGSGDWAGKNVRTYFIMRGRNGPWANQAVTFNSIRIDYEVVPPEDCNCPTNGACIPIIGTHTCNANGGSILCKCTYEDYGTAVTSFTAYPGIKQSGNPKYLLLKENGGLLVYDRPNDYSCIDLDTKGATPGVTLTAATTYTVTITGKAILTTAGVPAVPEIPAVGEEGDPNYEPAVPGTPAVPSTPTAQLAQSDDPYGAENFDLTGTAGQAVSFTITVNKTGAELSTGNWNRIRTSGTAPFIITSVKVQAGSDTPVIDVTFLTP